MTTNSDPYENAIAECINGILKEEFYCSSTLADHQQAEHNIVQSIKLYNARRPCRMLAPEMAHYKVSCIPNYGKQKRGYKLISSILIS